MISAISKLVNIDLTIIGQEQGYLRCEPLQYMCKDDSNNRYVLFIAMNPIQEYILKKDIAQQAVCDGLKGITVLKTAYSGEFQGKFFSLYCLPPRIKKNNRRISIKQEICVCDNTQEYRNEFLYNQLSVYPEDLQKQIKSFDVYRQYVSSISILSKLCVESKIKNNSNIIFIDELNNQIVCFAIDIMKNELVLPRARMNLEDELEVYAKAVNLQLQLTEILDEMYEEYIRATVTVGEDMEMHICPNIFFNRATNSNSQYLQLQVNEWKKKTELLIELQGHVAILHCFLMPISYIGLNAVIEYVFTQLDRKIYIVKHDAILYRLASSQLVQQAVILLPDSIENLEKRMSSKGRYNMRRERRIIVDTVGNYKIEVYNGDEIPEEYVNLYFEYKKASHNREYGMTAKQYIERQHVTTLYVMRTEDKVLAVLLSCEQNENVYFENFSYCPEYKSLSLGSVMYYTYLEELVKKRASVLFLGNGKYEYKKRYGSLYFNTFSGNLYRVKVLNYLWRIYYFIKERVKKLV